MKRLGLRLQGAFFNADSIFDTKDARKTCFNHGLISNIPGIAFAMIHLRHKLA